MSALTGLYPVSRYEAGFIARVCDDTGAHPLHLGAVINWETGGTWSPHSRNASSGAVGLIQFMPSTLKRLGAHPHRITVSNRERAFKRQCALLGRYLSRVALGLWPDDPVPGPLDTLQAVAMAVFYPPARAVPLDWEFPAAVRAANPKVIVVDDYMRALRAYTPGAAT